MIEEPPFESGDKLSTVAPGVSNPRRKPQNESVSLNHATSSAEPPRLRHGAGQNTGAPNQVYHSRPSKVRKEATEPSDTDISNNTKSTSSNLRSNPEDWYSSWNAKVKDTNTTAFSDNDPPYYLGKNRRKKPNGPSFPINGQTSQPSFPDVDEIATPPINFGLNMNSGMLPSEASSDSDSFRSVIDDLTIKNQKLKKRLRKLERLHCNEQEGDKLFEVRVHGLSRAKKKELDDILQKFALTISDNGPVDSPYQVSSGHGSSPVSKASMNPPSTQPRLNNNTDSAYASESRISRTPSNPVPSHGIMSEFPPPKIKQSSSSRNDATERVKMKLVVKRLEQVFTGREALKSAAPPSQKQQAISTLVAMDESSEKIASGELVEEEGPREAHLMSWQEDNEMKEHEADMTSVPSNTPPSDETLDGSDVSLQRPTRPIDLDPQRSLLPVENVHYLESMTQSQHKLDSANHYFRTTKTHNKPSNWVYFNLITNLAQLHTLNVTVPFIKRSINTLSTKLEFSPDGKKIRWKGGSDPTKMSSDSNTSASGEPSGSDESASDGAQPAKNEVGIKNSANSSGTTLSSMNRPKSQSVRFDSASKNKISSTHNTTSGSDSKWISPDHANTSSMSSQLKSPRQVMMEKFKYKPMCYGAFASYRSGKYNIESESESGTDSISSISSAAANDQVMFDSNGDNSRKSALAKKSTPIDGPVIYFGGTFCVDLSSMIVCKDTDPVVDTQYKQYSEVPLGPERPCSRCSSVDKSSSPFSNPANFSNQNQAMDLDSNDGSMECNITELGKNTYRLPEPVNLPASGLGGVQPVDNFMLHVLTSHPRQQIPKVHIHHTISKSSLNAFFEEKPVMKGSHGHEVLSLQNKKLAPSALPSPSYGIFSSSSEDSEELTASESRNISDSDISYQFPIDLDSRSEGEEDSWKKNDSSMDIDPPESLMPMSSAATVGGSVHSGMLSTKEGDIRKLPSARPTMSQIALEHIGPSAGISDDIQSTMDNAALSPRSLLKRARSSMDNVSLQDTKYADEQRPPQKLERLSPKEENH